jgi:hypothetical protein
MIKPVFSNNASPNFKKALGKWNEVKQDDKRQRVGPPTAIDGSSVGGTRLID